MNFITNALLALAAAMGFRAMPVKTAPPSIVAPHSKKPSKGRNRRCECRKCRQTRSANRSAATGRTHRRSYLPKMTRLEREALAKAKEAERRQRG